MGKYVDIARDVLATINAGSGSEHECEKSELSEITHSNGDTSPENELPKLTDAPRTTVDNVVSFPQIRDKGRAMIKREGCTGNKPSDYSPSDKVRIGQLIPCNERVDEPGGDTC